MCCVRVETTLFKTEGEFFFSTEADSVLTRSGSGASSYLVLKTLQKAKVVFHDSQLGATLSHH